MSAARGVQGKRKLRRDRLDFMGCREYRQDLLGPEDKLQPELTRNEYLRLLQTAKLLGVEQVMGRQLEQEQLTVGWDA